MDPFTLALALSLWFDVGTTAVVAAESYPTLGILSAVLVAIGGGLGALIFRLTTFQDRQIHAFVATAEDRMTRQEWELQTIHRENRICTKRLGLVLTALARTSPPVIIPQSEWHAPELEEPPIPPPPPPRKK